MFTHLPPGQYKIVALKGDCPVGVLPSMLPPPPFQYIRLGFPCQTWQVDRTFVLCGYPYTGVKDNKVIVSDDPNDNRKWKTVPYEAGSLITLADDPTMAWTVASEPSMNPFIVVAPISPEGPSSDQLFQIVPANE